MILKREITLKAVVTERLKAELIEGTREAISRVEAQQEELDRQTRRMMLDLQRADMSRAMAFRQQVEVEKRKQDDVKAALKEQLTEFEALEYGTEIVRGTLEGQVEIQPGDNIQERLAQAEILIEDDVVKEIRDPAPSE